MDLIVFAFSFVFSFIFIILGFYKESAVLEMVGTISLMILSIMLMTTGFQYTLSDYPWQNSTMVETTYSFAEESTVPIGWLFFIFSVMINLYAGNLILFGKKGA